MRPRPGTATAHGGNGNGDARGSDGGRCRPAVPAPDTSSSSRTRPSAASKLLEAIKQRAERGPIRCTVICPQNKPRKGFVIYDDSVRSAAQIRLDLTLERLRELGIEADGEVMDPDPFLAVQDAVRHLPRRTRSSSRRIPIPARAGFGATWSSGSRSTSSCPSSTWSSTSGGAGQARARGRQRDGRRSDADRGARAAGERVAAPLHDHLAAGRQGPQAAARPRSGSSSTVEELRGAGLEVVGQIMDPDPFTSVKNALQYHPADEIIISTFRAYKSRWQRSDLVERVQPCHRRAGRARRRRPGGARGARGRGRRLREPRKPHAHAHAAHPPLANKSSRVDAQLLGILLFIVSEAMLFGSFFTAYFFVRACR